MGQVHSASVQRRRVGWCAIVFGLVSCGLTERSHESSDASGSDTSTDDVSNDDDSSGGTGEGGAGGGGSTGGSNGIGTGGASEPSWQQQAELPEPGARVADFATGSVSLHDGTAAIGTISGEIGEVQVFVERGDDWVQEPLVLGADTLERAGGASVAVFEDTLLVGAPGQGAGRVYVFEREQGSWTETARLEPGDGKEGDGFGSSVALSGASALVGAWNGAAYLFARAGGAWHEEQRLTLGAGHGTELIGTLALDGDTALIGTRDEAAVSVAYVFVRGEAGWEQQQRLVPDVEDPPAPSGMAVALSGDTAFLGTQEDRGLAGAVHVFFREGNRWTEQQLLIGGENDEAFGSDVAMHGDVALVSNRELGGYTGGVYVFERFGSEWSATQHLVSPSIYDDGFGSSIAVFEDTALIAAPGQGELDQWFGSAYLFTRVTEP